MVMWMLLFMVTLLLSIGFYGNLTIINQLFMVTLLLSISFYGNLTIIDQFL